jgi:nicotinate-nucleotide adenylyltransferase
MNRFFQNHLVFFGGSFNPPHLGHQDAAQGLLKSPGVKKVLVMPSYGNPLKTHKTSFQDRFEMAKLNFPELDVSRFEEEQKTTSTFDLLSKANPISEGHPIAFAIGTDQFETLESWVNFPRVLSLADWLVLLRKPKTLDDCGSTLKKYESLGVLKATRDPYTFEIGNGAQMKTLHFVETEATNTSSTLIRENIALGRVEEVKKYLKSDVMNYIERNSLYGTRTNHSN